MLNFTLTVHLDQEDKKVLEKLCNDYGLSKSSLIRFLIRKELKKITK